MKIMKLGNSWQFITFIVEQQWLDYKWKHKKKENQKIHIIDSDPGI